LEPHAALPLAHPAERGRDRRHSDFLSRGGTVNRVPTAYAVPTMAAPLSEPIATSVPEASA
jgi:hypothetical protein